MRILFSITVKFYNNFDMSNKVHIWWIKEPHTRNSYAEQEELQTDMNLNIDGKLMPHCSEGTMCLNNWYLYIQFITLASALAPDVILASRNTYDNKE